MINREAAGSKKTASVAPFPFQTIGPGDKPQIKQHKAIECEIRAKTNDNEATPS